MGGGIDFIDYIDYIDYLEELSDGFPVIYIIGVDSMNGYHHLQVDPKWYKLTAL